MQRRQCIVPQIPPWYITQDLGRYVTSVGLGRYLPHASAGVKGRVVVNAELGLLGLFLQQLEVETQREKNRENFLSCSAPRIILKQIREIKAIIVVDYMFAIAITRGRIAIESMEAENVPFFV
jgi:hypothetical protein